MNPKFLVIISAIGKQLPADMFFRKQQHFMQVTDESELIIQKLA